MESQNRKRPPQWATASAVSSAEEKEPMFDSGCTISQISTVDLVVRAGGRVICLATTRAVRSQGGVNVAGFHIPAAVLP